MFVWMKAFHIIAMVAWFAGLFYLPRLYVYHAEAHDALSLERFKVMERRLYFGIMWPAALLTTVLGLILLWMNLGFYMHQGWMHAKLALVALLWGYHLYCGKLRVAFSIDRNGQSSTFYRVINEVPTLFLIAIVILVVVRPF